MLKLEIGTIIKVTLPRYIDVSSDLSINESSLKDITYFQVEGVSKKRSKFGYDYLEYSVFDLTHSQYTSFDELFICVCLKQGTMDILKN